MGFFPDAPTVGGPIPLPVTSGGTGSVTAAAGLQALGGMVVQATTGGAGTALLNSTPTFLTWTAPNDANLHRVMVFAALNVTAGPETGGAVGLGWTQPDGSAIAAAAQLFAAGLAAGTNWTQQVRLVKGNTTVTVAQTSALSVGTAQFYAEIWGL